MFVYHTIQASHLVANQHGFKRIFFSGGVIQSDYARFSLEAEMISRLSMHPDQSVSISRLSMHLDQSVSISRLSMHLD